MPLFSVKDNLTIAQIKQTGYAKERELQKLFEANLETLLGVRFIASEFTTGDRQRGRIDTLGLDQDDFPTIIEYKRSSKENIINQGLFYLDWLVDHKGDFTLAAQTAIGADVDIDWSSPRLILVAESFSEYDKYAVNRIGANVELWTFRRYGDDLLFLDSIFVTSRHTTRTTTSRTRKTTEEDAKEKASAPVYTLDYHTKKKPTEVVELFEQLREAIFALSSDAEISETANKMYISYKHGKNFCEVRLQASGLKLWLDIPQDDLSDPYHLTRDVSEVGHYGTGQTETKLASMADFDKIMALVEQSYQLTV
jgi:predicted transport protein